jgi:hypothetical protein
VLGNRLPLTPIHLVEHRNRQIVRYGMVVRRVLEILSELFLRGFQKNRPAQPGLRSPPHPTLSPKGAQGGEGTIIY